MTNLSEAPEADRTDPRVAERKNRDHQRFAVSANRGKARHVIRYVESGGAAVDTEECTFCQVTPSPVNTPE